MSIPDKLLLALEGLLSRDEDQFTQNLPVDESEQQQWIHLLTAVLMFLARERFGSPPQRADITRWVGWARTDSAAKESELDPLAAEGLLRGVLGDEGAATEVADRVDSGVHLKLIVALANDPSVELTSTDGLLAEAREAAEEMERFRTG